MVFCPHPSKPLGTMTTGYRHDSCFRYRREPQRPVAPCESVTYIKRHKDVTKGLIYHPQGHEGQTCFFFAEELEQP